MLQEVIIILPCRHAKENGVSVPSPAPTYLSIVVVMFPSCVKVFPKYSISEYVSGSPSKNIPVLKVSSMFVLCFFGDAGVL